MIFDKYEYTSRGGRSYNEDSVGSREDGQSGIFVVADGLGGHKFGELASSCVRDVLLGSWNSGERNRPEWIKESLSRANRELLSLQQEKNTVLKSTVVVLAIDNEKAVWANIGDSRLYYLHEDRIKCITEDHSVAYKKYKAGEITREQICTDDDQSQLLRSVGSEDRNKPDIYENDVLLERGDAFMLCSDGVWEYLKDEEILIDLLKSKTAREWAQLLLLRLMDRIEDGNDNLTILTLMLK